MNDKKLEMLSILIEKAKRSANQLWLLNKLLAFSIPFNKPHKFTLSRLESGCVEITLPYRRSNFNHIRGIHACAIATASEFASGMALLSLFRPSEYRIIMKSIQIDYHYQAKLKLYSRCIIESEQLNSVKEKLEKGAAFVELTSETRDQNDNHISTAKITWQLKKWDAVKTAL